MAEIQRYIPQTKHDTDLIDELAKHPYPYYRPILKELFEWVQDINWPVASKIVPLLVEAGADCTPIIRDILLSDDTMWMYWTLEILIHKFSDKDGAAITRDLQDMLLYKQLHLTEAEYADEIDKQLDTLLEKFNVYRHSQVEDTAQTENDHGMHHRLLIPSDPADLISLQRLYSAAPDYFHIVYGKAPDPNEAQETFTSLPPGYSLKNKTVFGFFIHDELIGVADLLNGYPETGILWIGLLLFSEKHQRKGYGRMALEIIYSFALQQKCSSVRLAVIATNNQAHDFWLNRGFVEINRKTIPDVTGEAIVMERKIQR